MKTAFLIPVLAILLATTSTAFATPEHQYRFTAETVHDYYNPTLGHNTHTTSFWILYGENIQWWQGGIQFVYTDPSDKIEILTKHLMSLFHDLGFITVVGTVKPTYAKIVYQFDGVLEYEGYLFADGNGSVVVEWTYGKPLVITIYSMVSANASTAKYLSGGTWEWVRESQYVSRLKFPESTVSLPSGTYDFLLIPREGYITTVYEKTRCDTTIPYNLGGSPKIHRFTLDGNSPGFILHDGGTFYSRLPVLKFVNGNLWYIDNFWCFEWQPLRLHS
jgi:hypothetical protein